MSDLQKKGNQMNKPELKEGEIYVGAIIGANGYGHHVILLPEHPSELMTWQEAMDWAKSIGGDLPSRIEQALLFYQKKDEFSEECYWSNTPSAAYTDYAWYQVFYSGNQDCCHKNYSMRARAVRRLPFKLGE